MKYLMILLMVCGLRNAAMAQPLIVSFGSPITFQPIAKDSSIRLTATLTVSGPGKEYCTVRLHPSADISVSPELRLAAGTTSVGFTFHPTSVGCRYPGIGGISLEAVSNASVMNPQYITGYVYDGSAPEAAAIPAADTLLFPLTIVGSTSTKPLNLDYMGAGKPILMKGQLRPPFFVSSYPVFLGPCPFTALQITFRPTSTGVFRDTLNFLDPDSTSIMGRVILMSQSEAADVVSAEAAPLLLEVQGSAIIADVSNDRTISLTIADALGHSRSITGRGRVELAAPKHGAFFIQARAGNTVKSMKICRVGD